MSERFRRPRSDERAMAAGLVWYALLVTTQREFGIARKLNARGITAFAPREWRWRRKNRYQKSKRRETYPAYPKYVFAGVPAGFTLPWAALAEHRLIRGYLGDAAGRPKPLSPGDIIRIMEAAECPVFVEPDENQYMRTGHEFTLGDPARVAEGSLEGLVMTIEGFEQDKAVGTLELLGRPTKVTLPLDILEKAA